MVPIISYQARIYAWLIALDRCSILNSTLYHLRSRTEESCYNFDDSHTSTEDAVVWIRGGALNRHVIGSCKFSNFASRKVRLASVALNRPTKFASLICTGSEFSGATIILPYQIKIWLYFTLL